MAVSLPVSLALLASATTSTAGDTAKPARPPTMSEVLARSKAGDWRPLAPENTLYLQLASGRVVIELAPAFAPKHAANIRTLAKEHYFDGLAIVRSQDNYVVQWGDPKAGEKEGAKGFGTAQAALSAEFTVAMDKDLPFTRLPDVDGYAPEVGFSNGFPAARDPKSRKAWLTHCYGMVGAGRDMSADSGSGSELYVVIGNAPRHLDRNITVVGRVVQGMELLSTLPRGGRALGFYEKPEQNVPITSLRLASEVAEADRVKLEVLRTDTPTFAALVESRRNRRDEWFLVPAGHVELCNVPIPVRAAPEK